MFKFECPTCNLTVNELKENRSFSYLVEPKKTHDEAEDHPTCGCCDTKVNITLPEAVVDNQLLMFDEYHQTFRFIKDGTIDKQYDVGGYHSCQYCYSPAKFNSCSAYYEHYVCVCCGRVTSVS